MSIDVDQLLNIVYLLIIFVAPAILSRLKDKNKKGKEEDSPYKKATQSLSLEGLMGEKPIQIKPQNIAPKAVSKKSHPKVNTPKIVAPVKEVERTKPRPLVVQEFEETKREIKVPTKSLKQKWIWKEIFDEPRSLQLLHRRR